MNIAGKTYRIKSRTRFTLFIAIALILIVTMANTILGFNDASSMTLQEYISIEIEAGDTLWQIASDYMPDDMDPRMAVHKLCQINSIDAEMLQPGQIIKVPVYI